MKIIRTVVCSLIVSSANKVKVLVKAMSLNSKTDGPHRACLVVSLIERGRCGVVCAIFQANRAFSMSAVRSNVDIWGPTHAG